MKRSTYLTVTPAVVDVKEGDDVKIAFTYNPSNKVQVGRRLKVDELVCVVQALYTPERVTPCAAGLFVTLLAPTTLASLGLMGGRGVLAD